MVYEILFMIFFFKTGTEKNKQWILDILSKWVKLTCVGETKSPQSEIWGSVGDTAQAILYRVNGLMNEHLTHVKLKSKSPVINQDQMC